MKLTADHTRIAEPVDRAQFRKDLLERGWKYITEHYPGVDPTPEDLAAKYGQPGITIDLREHDPEKNEKYFKFRDWLKLRTHSVQQPEQLLLHFYFEDKLPEKFKDLVEA